MNKILGISVSTKLTVTTKDIFFFIYLIAFWFEINRDFQQMTQIRYGMIALLILLFVYHLLVGKTSKPGAFGIWSIATLFSFGASYLWSITPLNTVTALTSYIVVLCIANLGAMMVTSKKDLEKFKNSVLFAILLNCFYIVFKIGISNIGRFRLGKSYAELELWNANEIGYQTAIGALLIISKLNKSYGIKKNLLIVMVLFLFLLTLNTGSRGAIIMFAGAFVINELLKEKGLKRVRTIILIVLIAVVSFYFISTNELLYNILGKRLETAFTFLSGNKTNEYSSTERLQLIIFGIQWFTAKPLLGYGLNTFRTMFSKISGIDHYAHNNYVELLVGVGAIGVAIYYSIYLANFKKLMDSALKNKDKEAAVLFALTISMFLIDIFTVSYEKVFFIFVIAWASKYIFCKQEV